MPLLNNSTAIAIAIAELDTNTPSASTHLIPNMLLHFVGNMTAEGAYQRSHYLLNTGIRHKCEVTYQAELLVTLQHQLAFQGWQEPPVVMSDMGTKSPE